MLDVVCGTGLFEGMGTEEFAVCSGFPDQLDSRAPTHAACLFGADFCDVGVEVADRAAHRRNRFGRLETMRFARGLAIVKCRTRPRT